MARFNHWWIAMWAVNTLVLAVLIGVLTPGAWLLAALGLFFVPEGIGLLHNRDSLPPLTYVIRRYVPRWVVDMAIYAAAGLMVVTWWHIPHPGAVIVIAGAVGWLTNHFTVVFESPGE